VKNGELRKARILLIDDDDLVLESYKAILAKEGYKVVALRSGEEALELLRKEKYDLILADLMMEGIDGLAVLKEARKLNPQVIVVIVTGFESMENAIQAMREGAYDYLPKPCTEIDLKMTVQRGLEKQKMERKLLAMERLSAITDTAFQTSCEINTPIESIIKELKTLLQGKPLKKETREGLEVILKEALRIKDVMNQMTQISEPVITEYMNDVKMVDVKKSKSGTPPTRKNDTPDQI
jgi:DNA-binding response OmpR family regulator